MVVLNTVDSNHGSLFKYKFGFTSRVLEVVHPEVFNVVEVLLRTVLVLLTQVAQPVEVPRQVAGMLTVEVLFDGVLVLSRLWIEDANIQGEIDTSFNLFRPWELHWIHAGVLVEPDSQQGACWDGLVDSE